MKSFSLNALILLAEGWLVLEKKPDTYITDHGQSKTTPSEMILGSLIKPPVKIRVSTE
jgi:hypothetical protein